MTRARFVPDAESLAVLGRCLLGLAVVGAAHLDAPLAASACLVLCVWADALTGRAFRRRFAKSQATEALETLADALCFIWAPIEIMALTIGGSWSLVIAAPVFALAAVWRLARFTTEGMLDGYYVGLPVTYAGYAFPLAALITYLWPDLGSAVFVILCLLLAALMVSRRLQIPEV